MNDDAPDMLLRVLLAEDDAVSQHFFATALAALGCAVDACGRGDEALQLARTRPYDLLLLDVRLPGLGGADLLQALRADAQAASRDSVALATSAAPDFAQQRTLLGAGFAGIVPKPVTLDALEALVQAQRLRLGEALLDDTAALRALGRSRDRVSALRGLLAAELTELAGDFEYRLRHDPASLVEPLHRLQAACGFCGVPALAAAAAALERDLQQHHVGTTPTATRFGALLAATRGALGGTGSVAVSVP
ncbi:MAG: response regulator [Xanthomonadaceae bacterium]|nr:response regulator [Xanthomonadaceae bacterium]